MSPNLALFIGILFILIVFRINSKREANISRALWIPLIWFAIVASRSVNRWLNPESFDTTNMNYLEGSPIDRTVYTILMAIGVYILLRRKVDWKQIIGKNLWIFILVFYMGLSIFWSDFMGLALKRWIKAIGDLVMVLVVLTESYSLEAVSGILRRCFFVLLPLSIIFIKFFRTIGVAYDYTGLAEMWVGVTTHKNSLGQISMTGGLYFMWNIMRKWGKSKISIDILYLLISLWLLAGSNTADSKTSIFLFFAGVIILLLLQFTRSKPKKTGRYFIFGLLMIVFFYLLIDTAVEIFYPRTLLITISEGIGRDTTLTGRTILWDDLLDIASQNPVLGVGYGSFWIGDQAHNLWQKYPWRPTQGHNGYIDVYLQLGLVGVLLLIGVIFIAYRNIFRAFEFDFEYARFRMILLTVILLHNVSESSLLRGAHVFWFLFLLVAVDILDISRLKQRSEMATK